MSTGKTLIIAAIVVGAIVTVAGLFSNNVFGSDYLPIAMQANLNNRLMSSIMGNGDMTSGMMGSGNMISGMMSQVPKDVIIKVTSKQQVAIGKQAEITLLVSNKETKRPLSGAQMIIGIQKGSSKCSMNMMMGSMFNAEDKGSGKFIVRFTPDSKGYYTLHTHVIPSGKSMHSMMDNHMDIGIIAK